jgi:hypothetical protein
MTYMCVIATLWSALGAIVAPTHALRMDNAPGPCGLGTEYVARSTDERIRVAARGDALLAVRDVDQLFTVAPDADAGNWTVAFGTFDSAAQRVRMTRGFQQVGALDPETCAILWANDEWHVPDARVWYAARGWLEYA